MQKWSIAPVMKFAIAIVIAVLVHQPAAFAACNQEGCIGPGCVEALVYDYTFTQGCTKWKPVNGATITTGDGGYASLTPTTGAVYQDLVVPPDWPSGHMEMAVWIRDITGTPGTEFYRVVVTTPQGSLLEYVDVFWPADNPTGRYDFYLSGHYSGQTIRVRVSRVQGSSPGNTVMRLDGVEAWLYEN